MIGGWRCTKRQLPLSVSSPPSRFLLRASRFEGQAALRRTSRASKDKPRFGGQAALRRTSFGVNSGAKVGLPTVARSQFRRAKVGSGTGIRTPEKRKQDV